MLRKTSCVCCHLRTMCHACRQGFGHVVEAANQLIEILKEKGPEEAVDIDDAAQRVALEVSMSPSVLVISSCLSTTHCLHAHVFGEE